MKQFKVYYQSIHSENTHSQTLECAAPITALNQFHRLMQEVNMLKPTDYNVVRLAEVYNSDTSGRCRGEWIESDYDLPKTSNPNVLLKQGSTPGVQSAMESILKEAEAK